MASTIQKLDESVSTTSSLAQMFIMNIGATVQEVPAYWSVARDIWLSEFWRRHGNDLLAGAVSTLQAKVVSAGWFIEGPLALAMFYRDLLLHKSEWGAGWGPMISKWVEGYLVRDAGGWCERFRTSKSDHTGPSLGFAHLDESKCIMTGRPDYPILYNNGKDVRKIHRSSVMQLLDMPSGRDSMRGIGFCGTSRALSTALILMDIVKYKRERLSDLMPAGLLLINNLGRQQWEDINAQYDTRQRREGNQVWRDIMVLLGVDPAYEISAELIPFSDLPEHYDERTAVEVSIYTFALAFRMDPRELWPVSAGPLGTATEAELQDRKAKAKGEGIIFTTIERELNNPLSIPRTLKFGFDFRDDEEDLRAAKIATMKIQNIRRMWEASPNMYGASTTPPGETPGGNGEEGEEDEDDAPSAPIPGSKVESGPVPGEIIGVGGMITTQEARLLLMSEGFIPPEFVGETLDQERMYDVRAFGPMYRIYNDGRAIPLRIYR